MTLTEADQTRRVAEAERRVAEANRRAADCRAAERRAEEVDQAERRAAEAEQRAAEAERHAPKHTPPKLALQTTAPAPMPAQRHTPKEIPVMSSRKQALLREVESASFRLTSARQGLEDAKFLARHGMASDPVFAAHVVAGAINKWNRASAAFLSFKG